VPSLLPAAFAACSVVVSQAAHEPLALASGSTLIRNHVCPAGMNLIFSPVYQATTGAVDDAETDVEAAKDAADFGSVKSMPLDNNYHVRVLIPCYKEPYEIVLRTVNAIRDAVLPAGALRTVFLPV